MPQSCKGSSCVIYGIDEIRETCEKLELIMLPCSPVDVRFAGIRAVHPETVTYLAAYYVGAFVLDVHVLHTCGGSVCVSIGIEPRMGEAASLRDKSLGVEADLQVS